MWRVGEFEIAAGPSRWVEVRNFVDVEGISNIEDPNPARDPSACQRRRVDRAIGRTVVRFVREQRSAGSRRQRSVLILRQIDFELHRIDDRRFVVIGDVDQFDSAGTTFVDGEQVRRTVVGDRNAVLGGPTVGPRELGQLAHPRIRDAALNLTDVENMYSAEIVRQVHAISVGSDSEAVGRQPDEVLPDDTRVGGIGEIDGAHHAGSGAGRPVGVPVR